MKIKVDCKLLSEQIQLLDMYSSVMSNKRNKELINGIVDFLDKISWAIEEEEDVTFVRVN